MSTTITQALRAAANSLEVGEDVELFSVDLRPVGGVDVLCFTSSTTVSLGGVMYTGVDVKCEGFEWNGTGPIPQPKLSVSNATRYIAGPIRQYNDLIGAHVTRCKVFSQFLDGGALADPNSHFPLDFYVVEQKTRHDRVMIELTLSASMDQQGRQFPGRQVLRSTCRWRYRTFVRSTGQFNYRNVTCPYTGNGYFDINNNPSSPDNDVCSKTITGCMCRYGNGVLPIGSFPGVNRQHI